MIPNRILNCGNRLSYDREKGAMQIVDGVWISGVGRVHKFCRIANLTGDGIGGL